MLHKGEILVKDIYYLFTVEDIYREDGSTVEIGSYLECEGYKAVLKYKGPVPPTKGIPNDPVNFFAKIYNLDQ